MAITELYRVGFFLSNTRHWHMSGRVRNDTKERYCDGEFIKTSRIVRIEKDRNDLIVETRNSRYLVKDYPDVLSDEELKIVWEWI